MADRRPVKKVVSKTTDSQEKERKKSKLSYAFKMKRKLGGLNMSGLCKNTSLNSSVMKRTLCINNRALARALESKRAELSTTVNEVIRLRRENHSLQTELKRLSAMCGNENAVAIEQEVNRRFASKMVEVQQAVQLMGTSMMATVEQIHVIMNICNTAGSGPVLTEERRCEELADRVPSVSSRPTALPPAVIGLASRVAVTGTDDDDDDDDYVDEDCNISTPSDTVDAKLSAMAPLNTGCNLSMIMEQSYNDIDLSLCDAKSESARSSYNRPRSGLSSRRKAMVFRPSDYENDEDDDVVKRCSINLSKRVTRSRSKSRSCYRLSSNSLTDFVPDIVDNCGGLEDVTLRAEDFTDTLAGSFSDSAATPLTVVRSVNNRRESYELVKCDSACNDLLQQGNRMLVHMSGCKDDSRGETAVSTAIELPDSPQLVSMPDDVTHTTVVDMELTEVCRNTMEDIGGAHNSCGEDTNGGAEDLIVNGKSCRSKKKAVNERLTDCKQLSDNTSADLISDANPKFKSMTSKRVAKKSEVTKQLDAVVTSATETDANGQLSDAKTYSVNSMPIQNSATMIRPVSDDDVTASDHLIDDEATSEMCKPRKVIAAYLSKPGNIVFNAHRRGSSADQVVTTKPARSKSRSTLPVHTRPRSKQALAGTNSLVVPSLDSPSSVFAFDGTPKEENQNRRRTVTKKTAPSPNDRFILPAAKAQPEKSRRTFTIANLNKVPSESTTSVASMSSSCSTGDEGELSNSPHGIMLVLANGKRTKPRHARSKTVRYAGTGTNKSTARSSVGIIVGVSDDKLQDVLLTDCTDVPSTPTIKLSAIEATELATALRCVHTANTDAALGSCLVPESPDAFSDSPRVSVTVMATSPNSCSPVSQIESLTKKGNCKLNTRNSSDGTAVVSKPQLGAADKRKRAVVEKVPPESVHTDDVDTSSNSTNCKNSHLAKKPSKSDARRSSAADGNTKTKSVCEARKPKRKSVTSNMNEEQLSGLDRDGESSIIVHKRKKVRHPVVDDDSCSDDDVFSSPKAKQPSPPQQLEKILPRLQRSSHNLDRNVVNQKSKLPEVSLPSNEIRKDSVDIHTFHTIESSMSRSEHFSKPVVVADETESDDVDVRVLKSSSAVNTKEARKTVQSRSKSNKQSSQKSKEVVHPATMNDQHNPCADENEHERMPPNKSRHSRQLGISSECETRECSDVPRSRRAAGNVCYKEPSLGSKLRQGDKFTSTIYEHDIQQSHSDKVCVSQSSSTEPPRQRPTGDEVHTATSRLSSRLSNDLCAKDNRR